MRHPAVTTTTSTPRFADLPADERALIRSVLNALNRAKTEDEADALALNHKRHRVPKRTTPFDLTSIPDELAREMERDSLDPKHAEFWHQYWKADFEMLREMLTTVARTGRLPADASGRGPSAQVDQLLTLFDAFVEVTREAKVSKDFRVSIRDRMRWENASGAAAYVILRLAQLSEAEPAVLCCEECGTFALIQPSVGSRMSRFCSSRCRNRSNQKEWRRKHPKSAAKHK